MGEANNVLLSLQQQNNAMRAEIDDLREANKNLTEWWHNLSVINGRASNEIARLRARINEMSVYNRRENQKEQDHE